MIAATLIGRDFGGSAERQARIVAVLGRVEQSRATARDFVRSRRFATAGIPSHTFPTAFKGLIGVPAF
jgi:hypothetical protein